MSLENKLAGVLVLEDGHIYQAMNQASGSQTITFRRDELPGQPGSHDGILCQQLVRILLDRVNVLNAQQPAHENIEILHALRHVLTQFEARALRRKLEKLPYPEGVSIGPDGHVFSLHDCGGEWTG